MSSGRAEVHPFDVTKLKKGDTISPERCEEVVGMSRQRKEYALKLLDLKLELERQWQLHLDETVTICCQRDGLHICTDEEAIDVNRRARLGSIRALERAQVRQVGVDINSVNDQKLRDLHERELVVGAAFLLGGRKHSQVALREHKRNAPTMLPPKKEK